MLDLVANHNILPLEELHVSQSYKKTRHHQKIAEGLIGSIYGIRVFAKTIRLDSVAYDDIEILLPTKSTYQHESIEIENMVHLAGNSLKN